MPEVIQSNTIRGEGSEDSKPVIFFDIDGTVDVQDTGQELLNAAGKCSRDEFDSLMSNFRDPVLGEPPQGKGNELVLYLEEEGGVEELDEVARSLEPAPRRGMESVLEDLSHNYTLVAHSAGWRPAIEAVTNGHFDGKLAADITEEGPVFNGKYQKPVRMQNMLVENGVDPVEGPVEVMYIGDSNTDVEAIRYAAATGGYGIAIGDSIEDAQKVDEASIYSADSQDHEFTSALLHHLATGDIEDTRRYVEEYGIDVSDGYAVPGELVHDAGEAQDAIDQVKKLG